MIKLICMKGLIGLISLIRLMRAPSHDDIVEMVKLEIGKFHTIELELTRFGTFEVLYDLVSRYKIWTAKRAIHVDEHPQSNLNLLSC